MSGSSGRREKIEPALRECFPPFRVLRGAMLRSDFRFDLPADLIAQEPVPRGSSRMLVLRPGEEHEIEHACVADFPLLVNPGDCVVVNDTRVFPARLFAEPKQGMQRRIETMLTRGIAPLVWRAMFRPARRVKNGDDLRFSAALTATVSDREGAEGTLHFRVDGGEKAFWREVDAVGMTPLPPYIHRDDPRDSDREAYQTVWARTPGAVAAPTAGLHFTQAILEQTRARGVAIANVTLHVGAGTFRPVTAERIADHRMDVEWYEIPEATARMVEQTRANGGRVIAIGTTSVRALESASEEGRVEPGSAETSIFITPGYQFRTVDALLTNFHLPESTLIMLVSAFAGVERTRRAYAEAIRERYRFYSYGDCMFITHRGDD